jgi:hypothetical protein
MAANDVCDGVVGPHVGNIVGGKIAEFYLVTLVRRTVRKAAFGAIAGKVHGESNVPTVRPMFGPFFEGFASTAMNQNNGGKRSAALCRTPEIGENAGCFVLERFTLVIKFLNQSRLSAPGDCWRVL